MGLGIGPDVPLDEHSPQSKLDYRFDLIDPLAWFELAHVLDYGAKKYGENNWRRIAAREHLNRVLSHTIAVLADLDGLILAEDQDNHIGHMLARAMFACALLKGSQESNVVTKLKQQNEELDAITAEYAKRYFRTSETRTSFKWSGHMENWICASCGQLRSAYMGCYTNTKVNICNVCFEEPNNDS